MNVLVLMSDQHNPKFLAFAGHEVVRTPNLDALASAGTYFDAAYCPSPICVPSRAAFATGRWVHEIRYWDNATGYDGAIEGWGHVLQRNGRRVESIGKLHYRREEDPTGFDRQHLPMHVKDGIGQVWGSVRDPLPRRDKASRMVSSAGSGESSYTRYDAAVTDRACEWLAEHSKQREDWVLYVGLVAPHFPYVAPEQFFDLYDPGALPMPKLRPDDGHRRHRWVQTFAEVFPGLDDANSEEERRRCSAAYHGLVSYLDHNIGQIVDALHRTGVADRTVIIYTSDHGDLVGTRGLWGKSLLYEESAGIPMIISAPGVPTGQICHTPVTLVDCAPTILAGAKVPSDPELPGRSLLDLAVSPADHERVAFSEYHAMGAPTAAFLLRKGRYKLHHYVDYEPELFDLTADPEETTDLAADPEHVAVLTDLERELHRLVDPVEVDRLAKADQAALVERFGGPAQAALIGTPGYTPAPTFA